MVDGFWKRWFECLHKLSPRQKQSREIDNLCAKDVVLVVDQNAKRGSWKLAEIAEVYPGEDGLVFLLIFNSISIFCVYYS